MLRARLPRFYGAWVIRGQTQNGETVLNGEPGLFVFRGETLEVEDLEEGWAVRHGDREVRGNHLDEVLATLLDLPVSEVLELMRQIVRVEEGSTARS